MILVHFHRWGDIHATASDACGPTCNPASRLVSVPPKQCVRIFVILRMQSFRGNIYFVRCI